MCYVNNMKRIIPVILLDVYKRQTQISIDKNLKHHVWVVRRTAFSGILTVKFFKVYLFNDTVNLSLIHI